jgi:hypothetical protein
MPTCTKLLWGDRQMQVSWLPFGAFCPIGQSHQCVENSEFRYCNRYTPGILAEDFTELQIEGAEAILR